MVATSGVAEPSIGWAFDAETGSVALRVVQDATAGAYALELPVVVTDASGVAKRMMITVPAEPFATVPLPGTYAARPRAITYDPDNRMLARITRL